MGDHKVNTNALRQKILDLAIHGKLVKQDPADEPASVMLEKLRAEKEAKVAAREIKRSKNDSYIFKYTGTSGESKTDDNPAGLEHNRHYEKFADGRVKDIEDDIPFAVPEGWAWCRLGEVCELKGGKRIPAGLSATKEKTSHIYIRVTDMKNNSISDEDLVYITDEIYEKIQRYTISKNDLYLTIAGSIGRVGIVPDKFDGMNLTENALKLTDISVDKKYLMLILNSPFVQDYFESTYHQVAMPKLSLVNASKTAIPLPPIAEQKRIVTAIETIFTQIDILETNKADLQTAVKQAKSKILDLAIRGKLVQQDPADEPASVMLEKLRAEKEAKIASGEMKRGKNDSYIYRNPTDNCYYQKYTDGCEENISDEIPFDVPAGWAWCKLPEVCRKPITDGTHNSPSNSASGDFLYITAKNIKNLAICLDDATYISKEIHESIYSRCSPELNDILLTKDGTIGEVAVNNLNYPFSMLSSIALIKPSNEILSWFLAYILISDLLQNKMKKEAKGSALKRIILAQINDFLIPLPPLAEQQRIVTKIEELFAQFDSIIAALAD